MNYSFRLYISRDLTSFNGNNNDQRSICIYNNNSTYILESDLPVTDQIRSLMIVNKETYELNEILINNYLLFNSINKSI